MENGGLEDTIIGRIGDVFLSADCCFRDIASFLKKNYAICLFFFCICICLCFSLKINKLHNLFMVVMARIQQTSDNITKVKQKQRNKNKENKTKTNKQTNKKTLVKQVQHLV